MSDGRCSRSRTTDAAARVKRVLITGVAGTGKSTVTAELAARGFHAVDADDPAFSEVVGVPEETLTGLGSGTDWVWREDRIANLLSSHDEGTLFVSGTSPNQGTFYSQFDHVVLLVAPPALIAERLATRTTNDFGKIPDELARVLQLQEDVEPLLRRGADLELDTSAPLDEVVAAILRHVTERES
jgi:dephospho-CoA kinase